MKATTCFAAAAGLGAFLTSASLIPCIWLPTIGRPGLTKVDQRSVILPPLTLTAAISTRSAIFGARAGRLDVHDDELVTGVSGPRELEDRASARLEERRNLRLADGLPELVLDIDEGLECAVAEQARLGPDVLGQGLGSRPPHPDRVP